MLSGARLLCAGAKRTKFAYLNLKDHPRGNSILHSLVSSGFLPEVVVEEDSEMASRDSSILLSDLSKLDTTNYPRAAQAQDILKGTNVNHAFVKNHNSKKCLEILRKAGVDAIVLGDCRILKPEIIAAAPRGVINTHPGFLPDVRGNHCSLYAIIHDLPIGCSSHFVDCDVDTGPLIDRKLFDLDWHNTKYEQLLWHLNDSCASLARGAFEALDQGRLQTFPQHPSKLHPFGTFTAMEPKMKRQAIKKLHAGAYHGGSFRPMHLRVTNNKH